jgi:pimeloyl-ACP methyl ester carboxylesterase
MCQCYAVSYRGHGASWYPFFLGMYFTTKRSAADDLVAAIKFVRQKEGREVVLVGHSSGGALGQLILSGGIGDVKVRGLALCAAMPCFGGYCTACKCVDVLSLTDFHTASMSISIG